MKYSIFCSLFLLLVAAKSPAQNTSLQNQFDQLLQAQFPADGPGAAVLIIRKGETLYKKAIGKANMELDVPLSTDHVFRIGSITKQFTSAAILRLAEEGKLKLQDDITVFIPDYPTKGKKITIEHLLNHTSGIKSYTEMEEWNNAMRRKDLSPRELIDFFKNEPMTFDPGTQYHYNNSGYILLGYIIEKASGKSYAKYLDEQFFKPLGMSHTYYDSYEPVIPRRAAGYSKDEKMYTNAEFLSTTQPYSAGALISTVEDLTTWTRALHSGKILQPESLQKAFKSNVLPDGTDTYYGYGWQMGTLLGSHTVEHGGAINGFLSYLIYVQEEDVCVAVLTNCDCNGPEPFGDKLAALAAGKDIAPAVIAIKPEVLSSYTGVYENDKKEQRFITVENGVLKSQRSGSSKFTLLSFAPGQFYFENSLSRIRFMEEGKGAKKTMKAIVSDRHSENNVWVKTDKPLPAVKRELELTDTQINPLLGEYQLAPGFTIIISREGNQLFGQATGQSRFEIYAESPTRFFLKVVDAVIEFYPDDKGAVPQMTLFQGGQELPGTRIK